MNPDIKYSILLAVSFLMLFGVAEYFYHKKHARAELTRKFVHICTGFITLLFPLLLTNHWYVLMLCGSFAVIILASLRYNFLPSINAIDRKSHGSICYPVAVYLCFLVFEFYSSKTTTIGNPLLYYYLPILTLAICDPMAAYAGRHFPFGLYKVWGGTKSLSGLTAFFLSSLIVTISVLYSFSVAGTTLSDLFLLSLPLAAIGGIAEAISSKGLDNITIPVAVLLTLIVLT